MPRTAQPRTSRLSSNPRHRSRAKLRRNRQRSAKLAACLEDIVGKLPQLAGASIRVRFQSRLTAHRGKLLCERPECGTDVYAASFIRRREIVLDDELIGHPRILRLILIHELFHFVWVRLGNRRREEFTALLADEFAHRARGELGESAALKKSRIAAGECLTGSKAWRDYVCESFCDTAACHYSRLARNPVFTLGAGWRRRREEWFENAFAGSSKHRPVYI